MAWSTMMLRSVLRRHKGLRASTGHALGRCVDTNSLRIRQRARSYNHSCRLSTTKRVCCVRGRRFLISFIFPADVRCTRIDIASLFLKAQGNYLGAKRAISFHISSFQGIIRYLPIRLPQIHYNLLSLFSSMCVTQRYVAELKRKRSPELWQIRGVETDWELGVRYSAICRAPKELEGTCLCVTSPVSFLRHGS